ncbi:transposable element Tcb2 transposase [Trichonephila clavipes]|nr:transposable element Tcb2 transposase [Trichonephila clavipes]
MAVGWMEMGLSQTDANRSLNVSRSAVHHLWNQYQTKASASRRHVPGRPGAITPAGDHFIALSALRRRISVPQLVAGHLVARPVVCVPFNRRQRSSHLSWAREHVSWTRQQWASVLFTDESRFTLESDSGHLLIWRERGTKYHQSKPVERHSYRNGGIMVWAWISPGGHTDLHVFQGGTLTGVIYRDEILDSSVRPYAGEIGNDFVLMDDNAQFHRAVIAEEYIEGIGLK